jgi:hypothetical protein
MWRANRTGTGNQTVISGRMSIRFVDFTWFSFDFNRVFWFVQVVSGAKLVRSQTFRDLESCTRLSPLFENTSAA